MARLLPQAEIAEIFGRDYRQVRRWRKDGCPFQKDGRKILMDTREVHDWLVSRELDRLRAELTPGAGEDLGEGDSPALERYRLARAIKAERENAEAEGLLVARADLELELRKLAAPIRLAIERLERDQTLGEAGPRAVDILEDALRAAQSAVGEKREAA